MDYSEGFGKNGSSRTTLELTSEVLLPAPLGHSRNLQETPAASSG